MSVADVICYVGYSLNCRILLTMGHSSRCRSSSRSNICSCKTNMSGIVLKTSFTKACNRDSGEIKGGWCVRMGSMMPYTSAFLTAPLVKVAHLTQYSKVPDILDLALDQLPPQPLPLHFL